jgi:hypothetical protein
MDTDINDLLRKAEEELAVSDNRGDLGDDFYYRNLPNDQSRDLYLQIMSQATEWPFDESFSLTGHDSNAYEDAKKAYAAVQRDHPDFFFLGNLTRGRHQGNKMNGSGRKLFMSV